MRVIGTMIVAVATLFIKMGSSRFRMHKGIRLITKNQNLLFGLALYVFASIFQILAYKGGDLSVLYPINSLSFVISVVLSVLVLKEKMNVYRYLSIMLIVVGIVIIVQ